MSRVLVVPESSLPMIIFLREVRQCQWFSPGEKWGCQKRGSKFEEASGSRKGNGLGNCSITAKC